MSTTHAICHFCVLSCGVKAEIDDSNGRRELSSLIGDKDDPAFHGYSCARGRDLPALLRHRDRLLRPLARRADGFEPIGSDLAIREAAGRLPGLAVPGKVERAHGATREIAQLGLTRSEPSLTG